MAVANRHRRRTDMFVGDELAQATLDAIIDRALLDHRDQVCLTAHVAPQNKASKRLCERLELERTGTADSGYEVWAADLFLAIG
jgi:RimJ/RimL family protein N-acetyltransferase